MTREIHYFRDTVPAEADVVSVEVVWWRNTHGEGSRSHPISISDEPPVVYTLHFRCVGHRSKARFRVDLAKLENPWATTHFTEVERAWLANVVRKQVAVETGLQVTTIPKDVLDLGEPLGPRLRVGNSTSNESI